MLKNVIDRPSNRPEHIVEAAKAIGRSRLKRLVFEAIYYHKKRVKSVAEIMDATSLTRMQVLQNAGALAKFEIIEQGKSPEGTCYIQIPFFQTHKKEILQAAGDKKKIAKIATKRNQISVPQNAVSFERSVKRKFFKTRLHGKTFDLKIAFLSTNPDSSNSLRTDIEIRNVQKIIQTTKHRDKILLKHVPAAEWQDLVDTLNEFEPDILHFSGHGGGASVLFDNDKIYDDGGVELDFDLIHRFIKATNNKPALIVFNACDTVQGANIFLESVPAVIAMSDSIDDAAADFFATRFYAAIGNGQSFENSLEQAKASLAAAGFNDADLPMLITSKGYKSPKFFT